MLGGQQDTQKCFSRFTGSPFIPGAPDASIRVISAANTLSHKQGSRRTAGYEILSDWGRG